MRQPQENNVFVTEVSVDSHRSSIMHLQNKSMIIFSESDLNIAGTNGTVRCSHSEPLDEELQVTGCTPLTPEQGHQNSVTCRIKM